MAALKVYRRSATGAVQTARKAFGQTWGRHNAEAAKRLRADTKGSR